MTQAAIRIQRFAAKMLASMKQTVSMNETTPVARDTELLHDAEQEQILPVAPTPITMKTRQLQKSKIVTKQKVRFAEPGLSNHQTQSLFLPPVAKSEVEACGSETDSHEGNKDYKKKKTTKTRGCNKWPCHAAAAAGNDVFNQTWREAPLQKENRNETEGGALLCSYAIL